MGYSNAGAELLLPEVDDVDIMSDSELEQISHEVFRLLPGTPKRVFLEGCIQEEARDSIIVVNFLKHSYRNKYFGKIDNLEEILCRVLDPKNRGLVRQTVFAEGFPFILRLVQVTPQPVLDLIVRFKCNCVDRGTRSWHAIVVYYYMHMLIPDEIIARAW